MSETFPMMSETFPLRALFRESRSLLTALMSPLMVVTAASRASLMLLEVFSSFLESSLITLSTSEATAPDIPSNISTVVTGSTVTEATS